MPGSGVSSFFSGVGAFVLGCTQLSEKVEVNAASLIVCWCGDGWDCCEVVVGPRACVALWEAVRDGEERE